MTDRVSSGSERLDAVLGGGLLMNSINVVMGLWATPEVQRRLHHAPST